MDDSAQDELWAVTVASVAPGGTLQQRIWEVPPKVGQQIADMLAPYQDTSSVMELETARRLSEAPGIVWSASDLHERRRAERMEDPEFRTAYQQAANELAAEQDQNRVGSDGLTDAERAEYARRFWEVANTPIPEETIQRAQREVEAGVRPVRHLASAEAPVKQVIVIRRIPGVPRGKEIAQACHAAMAFMRDRLHCQPIGDKGSGIAAGAFTRAELAWMQGLHRTVTCQVPDLVSLLAVEAAAQAAGVQCHAITDAGLTVFHGEPTVMALAVGPDLDSVLEPITGYLRLY